MKNAVLDRHQMALDHQRKMIEKFGANTYNQRTASGARHIGRGKTYGPHKTMAEMTIAQREGRTFDAIVMMRAIDKRERRARRGW